MFVFFFFQAEDGIRDATVTGVQTCALPISSAPGALARTVRRAAGGRGFPACRDRSEERRVGKGVDLGGRRIIKKKKKTKKNNKIRRVDKSIRLNATKKKTITT